jgi:hypothetical protein
MSNEIDLLMDIDPDNMSDRNIDNIIAYMREHQRQHLQQGIKPKKAEGPKRTIDLTQLRKARGLPEKDTEPPPPPMKRRSF